MMRDKVNWETYYQKVSGHSARLLLKDALEHAGANTLETPRQAIDLGCGDGTETLILLEHGWSVLAIDGEPAGITQLQAKVLAETADRLETRVANFENIGDLPSADLIYASLSLPFCHPQHFDGLWTKIVNSITSGGWFAGNFFGVNDSWTVHDDITFYTEEQVRKMLEPFEIAYFHEEDEEGRSTIGLKHWHIFTVIARKR
jgi:trans-aconitate methyltransferase